MAITRDLFSGVDRAIIRMILDNYPNNLEPSPGLVTDEIVADRLSAEQRAAIGADRDAQWRHVATVRRYTRTVVDELRVLGILDH